MVATFAEALMGADADAVCGAQFGVRSADRVNTRNGYRRRDWDTRACSVELAIRSCVRAATSRTGCSSVDAGRRRRWSPLVATSYLLGVHAEDGEAGRDPQTSTHDATHLPLFGSLVDLSDKEDARPTPSVGTPRGRGSRRQPGVARPRACLTGGGEVNEGWTPFGSVSSDTPRQASVRAKGTFGKAGSPCESSS